MLKKLILPALVCCVSVPVVAQIPLLDSDPTITNKVVYLDFDGETVTGTGWNNGNTINANASSMSAANITTVFRRVCEDYTPFNVSITTNVAKFNAAPPTSRMRVIITPTSAWYGSAGGVAFLGSFTWGGTPGTPCWIFENQLGGNVKNVAEAISHEVGHTLSLMHQSTYSVNPSNVCVKTAEYNPGKGGSGMLSWAPIMGVGYNRNVTVWHNGQSASNCNTIQYDHSNGSTGITGPGRLTFRTDDVGNTVATGKLLNLDNLHLADSGRITEPSDIDVYKFAICSNRYVTIDVKPWALDTNLNSYQGANLDVRLFLYNAANATLAVDTSLSRLHARIGINLTPGTYYFSVDGGRANNYSDYGSLGRYYLKVKATNPPQLFSSIVLPPPPVCPGQSVVFSSTSAAVATQWTWSVDNFAAPTATYSGASPVIPMNAGTNTIRLLTANGSSVGCAIATLNVAPELSVSGATAICTGGSSTLTASGASNYTWQPSGAPGSAIVVSPQANAVYTVIGSDGTCTNSATAAVALTPGFSVGLSASATTVCPGEWVTITANGANSYTFEPGSITGAVLLTTQVEQTTYTVTALQNGNPCPEVNTITIGFKECEFGVGINEQDLSYALKVYPNPASGDVVVELPEMGGLLEILTATGQYLNLPNTGGLRQLINTSAWSPGLYLLKWTYDKKVYTQKLLIER